MIKYKLEGVVFGVVRVISHVGGGHWSATCLRCGKNFTATGGNLRSGRTQSCGCVVRVDRSQPTPPDVEGARWISLGHGRFTLVDADDYATLATYVWGSCDSKYATRMTQKNGKAHVVRLHEHLIKKPQGMFVDHINRNTMDNRRTNLRLATKAQNGMSRGLSRANRSGFKGVWRKRKKWASAIKVNRRRIVLGTFDSAESAAWAYDAAAMEHHGCFAFLNFPRGCG